VTPADALRARLARPAASRLGEPVEGFGTASADLARNLDEALAAAHDPAAEAAPAKPRRKGGTTTIDETAQPSREHRPGGDDGAGVQTAVEPASPSPNPTADIQPPVVGQTAGALYVGDVPSVVSAEAGGGDAATARLPAHDLFEGDQK
jgi:hypothetical protein